MAAIAPAGALAEDPADLILRNGAIYTVDADNPTATAIAIAKGRIVAVGNDDAIAKYRKSGAREIDLGGKFVLPGFIDSHTHITEGGDYASGVQLRDAKTLAEVQSRVAAYAKAHPDKKWILGEAWSYGYPDMPGSAPTKEMLDKIVSDRPVFLSSGMAHAGWTNSRALELAAVTASTPNPRGGEFVRDASGAPTGWLKEDGALNLLRNAIPRDAKPTIAESMSAAMKEAARVGVTRLVSAGGDWEALPLLGDWEAKKKLTVRFSISEWAFPSKVDDAYIKKVEDGRARYHSDWLRTGAIKFIEDGVIESHTGFLPDGYTDRPEEKGMSFWDAQTQKELVIRLNKLGFQVYTHAIGDGAIHQTLDAYEAAEQAGAPPDLRDRIEHYEAPYPADIDRLVRLNVVASMQPAMIYPKDQWMGMEGIWQRYAGDKRFKTAFPIRSVIAKGGHVAFGTDWPIIDLNPLFGIRDAVLRQSVDGEPKAGWLPSERITVAQAIKGYTLDSAWAAHREKDEGSIAVGKLADIIILSDDLTKMDPAHLQEAKVLTTIVGGRIVYQAEK